mgnify:CR=1 FL=1
MADQKEIPLMERIVSLCKRRGFVFQSSEIYGGINGFWDYGPLGIELKRNVKELWWRSMCDREDVEGIDAAILMHPRVWEASGHVAGFVDPLQFTRQQVALDVREVATPQVLGTLSVGFLLDDALAVQLACWF